MIAKSKLTFMSRKKLEIKKLTRKYNDFIKEYSLESLKLSKRKYFN